MKNKKYASFVANGYKNNSIFDLKHPSNRDNCFYPFYLMREELIKHGCELNTVDLAKGNPTIFDVHMNVQDRPLTSSSYLLMLETPQIYSNNGLSSKLDQYRRIFTWSDDLLGGEQFIKINFPNIICIHPVDGFENRDYFCCLIAGNKTLTSKDDRNLYPERVKAIRWFEQFAPQDFNLYGVDWNMPVLHRGLRGKLERRIFRIFGGFLKIRPFPSYHGQIEHKREVLARTRFSICYENIRDLPGYITEKIFDCFFSGCVPVYWGANNITTHIPEDCFIDRRKFRDTGEVYAFLKAMSEQEYKGYQQRIAEFLISEQAYPFSAEYFAETVSQTIVKDFES